MTIPKVTLKQGDCLTLMHEIADASIDFILCDLPYGITECPWDSPLPLDRLWSTYRRVLKPGGAVALHAMQPFSSALVSSNPVGYRSEWIWEKGNATGFLNAKRQQLRAHESILIFYDSQPTFNPQMTEGHARKTTSRETVNSECYGKAVKKTEYDSTSRYPRSVLFFSSDKQKGNFHPTQKPVKLAEYFINTYTNPGDIVLDNCMGSGTTGVAAIKTGRGFVGIERESRFFDIAAARIKAERDRFDRLLQ